MLANAMAPLPIKGVAAPLLRPLPTVLTYAACASESGFEGSLPARSMFTSYLRAFKVMLVALARSAELSDRSVRPMIDRCENLVDAGFGEMPRHLDGFKAGLGRLHEDHSRTLKDAARREPDRLRDLFRVETGPCLLMAVHDDQTWPLADSLQSKLVEGCWYDCISRHQDEGPGRLEGADVILLVIGDSPLRPDFEEAAEYTGLPLVVLAAGNRLDARNDMAVLRTEHHYRNGGRPVLGGSFTPVRLYQAIDGCRMRRYLDQESFSKGPAVSACV